MFGGMKRFGGIQFRYFQEKCCVEWGAVRRGVQIKNNGEHLTVQMLSVAFTVGEPGPVG